MGIFVNRVLNMKQIKAIGFDMDYTLVRYYSDVFENLTHEVAKQKLVRDFGYPEELLKFTFNPELAIRGLVIDKETGNILKVSTFNKIKHAHHGTKPLHYKEQQRVYRGLIVDLNDPRFRCVDTSFSMAHATIYGQIVELKDTHPEYEIGSYYEIERDVMDAVDISHRDGSLKDIVAQNLSKYIILDKKIPEVLERFKAYGKKLWVITNSDYAYTKRLLDYTLNPCLKNHKDWTELFELVVTLANKPRFFTDDQRFLKVDDATGMMSNVEGKILPGIYQGGNSTKLQKDFDIAGDEILYLGDHIYGDIVALKKACNWRTALVVEELNHEVQAQKDTQEITNQINQLMDEKVVLERDLDDLYTREFEQGDKVPKETLKEKFDQIEKIDKELGTLIKQYEQKFNVHWGEVMRAGAEPSRFAGQIEKYACIYMSKISDFVDFGPRTYFRPKRKVLAHEMD